MTQLKHKRTLFIFHRDLRVEDNIGLIQAIKNSEEVIPAFIFTKEQINHNPYRSDHCLQFMIECLEDLNRQLKEKKGKLYLFYGDTEHVVEKCIKILHVDNVISNRDYTPFSQRRDAAVLDVCQRHQVSFAIFDDALLQPPENALKSDGKPYTVFTPYFRNSLKIAVEKPCLDSQSKYYNRPIEFAEDEQIYKKILPTRSDKQVAKGGREEGLKILRHISQFENYVNERDFPSKEKTTLLSAYMKFTVFSPREVYQTIKTKLGEHHELIRALYWRDFFTHIAFYFPYVFEGAFHKKYDKIKWSDNKKDFEKWCEGQTGFPIVDAGMRQMNQTGFMHNRVRMIVASFLTKDLHIDWRWGEKYFAQKLIDYDPAVNNGNWQWSASTGCDAQPYFRIFNPWNQQEKFDPECEYIKSWVPELKGLQPKEIHQLYKSNIDIIGYPKPMVDHSTASKIAIELYRAERT